MIPLEILAICPCFTDKLPKGVDNYSDLTLNQKQDRKRPNNFVKFSRYIPTGLVFVGCIRHT